MSRMIDMDAGPLGRIEITPTRGKLSVTPASLLMVEAVGRYAGALSGAGIDWGTGSGCIAIAAARAPRVERVVGLDVSAADVRTARANAVRNGVADVVSFLQADVFEPVGADDAPVLAAMEGATHFLTANPPALDVGDGLGWRRRVMTGARSFLVRGAKALVQISYQYGIRRIAGLAVDVPGYRYEGVAATTGWVPFDLRREDLARQLVQYADEEAGGGLDYVFRHPEDGSEITAVEALDRHRAGGASPLSKWQAHLFHYEPV